MKFRNTLKKAFIATIISSTVIPVVSVPVGVTFADEAYTVDKAAPEKETELKETAIDTASDEFGTTQANDSSHKDTSEDDKALQSSNEADGTDKSEILKNNEDSYSIPPQMGGGENKSTDKSSDKSVQKAEKTEAVIETKSDDSTGWKSEKGKWFYYKDGVPYTGWHYMSAAEGESKEHWSYFGKNGALVTGWKHMTAADGEKTPHWSYFGDNGWLRTGWKHMTAADGEKTPHWSYFGDNGWLRTGWVQLGAGTSEPDNNTEKHWSYFGDNGWLRTDWVQLGKGTSNPDGNSPAHWSYFGTNGWLKTGWQRLGAGTSNPDGNSEAHVSYFGDNGWLVTGSATINGSNYVFDGRGWLTEKIMSSFSGLGAANSEPRIVKIGDNYTLWSGSSAVSNASVRVGNADVKTNSTGVITSLDYNVPTWINQLNYYGSYPMACGAAATLMALQANGYGNDLSGQSGWNSLMDSFRAVRGSSYGKRYGNGVMTSAQMKQCVSKNSRISSVPTTALTGSNVTTAKIQDALSHGQTVSALVALKSSTHWIAVTGWYKNGNTTMFRVADPWPKDGKTATNYVTNVTKREDAFYSDRLSSSDLWSILNASHLISNHGSRQMLVIGNYK